MSVTVNGTHVDLTNLHTLEPTGSLNRAFANKLRQVCEDCMDRPHEGDKRKVIMEVEVTPRLDGEDVASGVTLAFNFKSAIPPLKSTVYLVSCTPKGTPLL
jgi:hypothetical protein